MTEFENLTNSYVAAIQFGLIARVDYQKAWQGNEILHHFCERLVDNSNYCDTEKAAMKQELALIKETLAREIEHYYKKGV